MLQYVNHCPFTISVAIMWLTPNCPDGGRWTKKGWWNIPPGESRIPYGGDLTSGNLWWADLIMSNDRVWPGSDPPTWRFVPLRKFEWCEWVSSTDAFQANFFVWPVHNPSQVFEVTP